MQIVCQHLGKKADVIYIPTEILADLYPSERDELLYDKSQNHIFDNTKIKTAVPAFKTLRVIEEEIPNTIDHLVSDKNMQKVDVIWNAIIDVIIENYEKKQGEITHKASLWSKLIYYVFQKTNSKILRKIFTLIIEIKGKL